VSSQLLRRLNSRVVDDVPFSMLVAPRFADMDDVPVPHFGVCLTVSDFHDLSKKLQSKGVKFVVEPHIRFKVSVAVMKVTFPLELIIVCT